MTERGIGGRTYKKKPAKNLNDWKADSSTRAGLDTARHTEWMKWKSLHAAQPIEGDDLKQLLDEGRRALPLQWVDVDKNEHKRRDGGPFVAPEFKSRLVNRGDLENTEGVRTDSPTCDLVGINMIISWCSIEGIKVKCADITNAYFQG